MTNNQRFKAIYQIIRKIILKPSSIFLVLKDETEYELLLKKKYGKTRFPTIDINNFLINKTVEVGHYTFLDGSSLITDLVLLKSIASSFKDCEYLEIGTWRGESILNVSDTGANCTSINLSPEEIILMGLPDKYANQQGYLIKDQKNIQIIHANSLTFDFSKLNKKFNLIFVDGDHSYNAVRSDTKNVFELLKDDNSIIVWHDYGYNPETPRYSVIAAILEGLPTSSHKHLFHVSNTICAIYSKREYETIILDSFVKPEKVFKIELQNTPFEK